MTASLCEVLPEAFGSTANQDSVFKRSEADKFHRLEKRELPIFGSPKDSCKTSLFFGFFFDGTKNNYVLAENGKNHSNVARLYDCYPGLSVPGVLPSSTDWQYKPTNYTHFFKVYVPGVSSPFKEVNDSGAGKELVLGAATGYRGDARIVWALLQAINNVHRYFHKSPLVDPTEALKLVPLVELSPTSCRAMDPEVTLHGISSIYGRPREIFESLLKRLHKAVSQHWPDKQAGRPKKIDPGIVQTIFVSMFGFSRGATETRAFATWLLALAKLDAHLAGKPGATTLGGFDMQIDFMGVFDTVASVGAGNTLGNSLVGKMLDGHGAWADSETALRIPAGVRCLHLVAAHEVRRSFPLDSISVGQTMPDNCSEVVFPGVHSDVGGGYCPCEQGKGVAPDGGDLLSRVPLVYMYKYARLAGVPLKLEFASSTAQQRFQIDPNTIKALNDYLTLAKCKAGPLHTIMREQSNLQMQWRLSRRAPGNAPLESTASFARASVFDQNDLHSANLELEKEVAAFESWLAQKGSGFQAKAQPPGFKNEHESEWEEIATWWKKPAAPAAAMQRFFDEFVHDSRAWFKLIPGNPDSEADMHALLKEWVMRRESGRKRKAQADKQFLENQKELFRRVGRKQDENSPRSPQQFDGLTDAQRKAAEAYMVTGKIPAMLTEGREPFDWSGVAVRAGYLRYRKVYAGRDSLLISDTSVAEPDRMQA